MSSDVPPTSGAVRRMEAIHTAHAGALFRFLLGLSRSDRPLAEDLLQETMLRVWRRIDVLPDDEENVRRWLFTIARHVCIDAARMRRARPAEVSLADAGDLTTPGDDIGDAMALHVIRTAFTRLSTNHRAVLRELHVEGRSTGEAATRLGLPVGTVKSRAFHALRLLRADIGCQG